MSIILIGFMGAGKSTVGKILSERLGWNWIDMDELVLQKTKTQNMGEVFAKGGEFLLRATEIAIAGELASTKEVVISAGGGVVLNKIILDSFKKEGGKVVFLHVPFEQIAQRLREDHTRPLFCDIASARKLYDFRLPLYKEYADQIIQVANETADEIAAKIQVESFLSVCIKK